MAAVATPEVVTTQLGRPVPSLVPKKVSLQGELLFDLVVGLLAVEELVLRENGRDGTESVDELCNAICTLYHAAFGPIFLDDDESAPEMEEADSYAPLYRQAIDRMEARVDERAIGRAEARAKTAEMARDRAA